MSGPKPTTEESFVLKAKGLMGDTARYLWANITGEREKAFSMRDIETPSAWINRSDPDYTPSIYNEPRSYLRAELPDIRKVGVAAYAKARVKQGVVRQMTTKNPGYKFGGDPELAIPMGKFTEDLISPYDIEDTTQAVLRAIDKLPDEEFRQIGKFDMLNKSEYAKEAATQGSFGAFYEYSLLEDVNRIAIPYEERIRSLPVHVTHEITHGTIHGARYRPVKGAPFPPKSQQGNRPISVEDKTLFRSVEVSSPKSVPYEDRPTEITSRIVANIVKAMPSKLFKGGKIPQTVFDGIVRGAAKVSLKAEKPVSFAPRIRRTKGWKFIPEGNNPRPQQGQAIMIKGETRITENIDYKGNVYYQIELGKLKLPDRHWNLQSAINRGNQFRD